MSIIEAAVTQAKDSLAGRSDPLVVGCRNDGHLVLPVESAQEIDHFASGLDVQVSRRLVAEENLGPVEERSGDRNPLPFAPGERRGTPSPSSREAHGIEKLVRTGADPRGVTASLATGEEGRESDVLPARQVIEEVVGLKDVAHHAVAKVTDLGVGERPQIEARDATLTLESPVETADDVEQGGLTGTRPAHQREEVVILDHQVDAPQDIDLGARIALAKVLESNHGGSVTRRRILGLTGIEF